ICPLWTMQVQGPFLRHNSTPVSSFVLTAYFNLGSLRWLFFCALLLLYLLMIFSNVLLVCVIALNRSLHEPMYMFLCSLFINELYGSAALFPFLLVHILRDVHIVPAPFCFFQIYVIFGYGVIQLQTLAGMSYDRYVAICHPLHYRTRMSRNRTVALILFPWTCGLLIPGVMISLSSSLELCRNDMDKVYCDNYPIIKLACYDTTIINIYGIVMTFNIIVYPLIVISCTYLYILKVCWRGEKRTRQKALNTCAPHLASVLNFAVAGFFEILQSRFNMSHVPNMLRVFLSLYFFLCQPLFNPLIYALKAASRVSTGSSGFPSLQKHAAQD
uniref:G-protein coupled receptors family 1 profile domain-containing protein n=1 Tax=Neogobius melanostomus TaxID=47308 RepID=A0A8C6TFS4_9GOBI